MWITISCHTLEWIHLSIRVVLKFCGEGAWPGLTQLLLKHIYLSPASNQQQDRLLNPVNACEVATGYIVWKSFLFLCNWSEPSHFKLSGCRAEEPLTGQEQHSYFLATYVQQLSEEHWISSQTNERAFRWLWTPRGGSSSHTFAQRTPVNG